MSTLTEKQRGYFNANFTKNHKFREEQLRKLYNLVDKYEAKIATALYDDLGKSPFESYLTETSMIKEEISYSIKHLKSWMAPKHISSPLASFPSKGTVYPEPLGLSLIISPWNYPIQLALAPLAASMSAGNCTIVKPSEYSPSSSILIKEMLATEFDESYISVVLGNVEISSKLLEEKFDHIFFTGSTKVGKIVMTAAAKHLTPVTLELGGKSPCIVDKTADIKLSAKRIVWGKFLNAGQTCVAPDYILADNSIKNQLMDEMKVVIKEFYSENPIGNNDYPKIISQHHFERLQNLLSSGEIFYGGKSDKTLCKLEPTILNNVLPESHIMEEEIFGPILPVLGFDDFNRAVCMIRGKPKPLALYLFTKSSKNKKTVLSNLSFGGGCINDTIIHLLPAGLPFGGVGESGMGCYHGKAGFDTFSHYKSIMESSTLVDFPIKYPPYGNKLKYIKLLLK